ncbi:MAG: hypothetical protein ABI656_13605 [bacterium]
MSYELMHEYEIEYSSAKLPESEHWAAMVAVYGPSHSPMHRNSVFPIQRVSMGTVFTSAEQAEAEAHKVALQLIEHKTSHA